MIVSALLFYRKSRGNLKNIVFEFNTYYPCVYNRIKVGKQHTVIFYVDNVMSSHVNPNVNDKFKERMNCDYGKHGEVKANRGKLQYYLGNIFDFTEKVKVTINMDDYVERMINDYPMKISNSDTDFTPTGNNIIEKGNRKRLVKNKPKLFILHYHEECLWPRY